MQALTSYELRQNLVLQPLARNDPGPHGDGANCRNAESSHRLDPVRECKRRAWLGSMSETAISD